MENKLPEEFKAKWLTALRSGDYIQGQNMLYDGNAHCCLGVACEINGDGDYLDEGGDDGFPNSDSCSIPLILTNKGGRVDRILVHAHLADMNDKGHTFEEIANWIEKHL